ncbi:MAG: UbiA family prenyltransferase [Chromatiales bacterium]|nr:UbiA family prenyltransferase [Chromatiales bacterium]
MTAADSHPAPPARVRRRRGLSTNSAKPRVVALIVFTAVVGMFLAVPGHAAARQRCCSARSASRSPPVGAAAINHVRRPPVRRADGPHHEPADPDAAHVDAAQALGFALRHRRARSMLLLWLLVNPLTAVLTFASLIGYAVLYTVWLKHATPQNIVIGGAAGAAPPVLGWTAVTGSVDPARAAAVPDHLRLDAAALLGARHRSAATTTRSAGIPMLPVTHGVAFTRLHILLYTILLVFVITLLPLPDRHERLDLSDRRRSAGPAFPELRHAIVRDRRRPPLPCRPSGFPSSICLDCSPR